TEKLSVESTQYFRLLRRNWLIFVSVICVGVGGAYLAYLITPAQYRSTVVFYVESAPTSTSAADAYQAELLSQARAQTYQELPNSENVAQQLGKLPGVGLPTAKLQSEIVTTVPAGVATAPAGSALIQVTVTDPSQRRATGIAL